MAGDWIKMRTNLDTDPRIIQISATLGIPELHVVGCLWKLWSWADSHSADGNAICVTSVTLDRFTSVTGFADALRKVGWLEGRDSALTFPRFVEHNGKSAKKRCENKDRVAKHRNTKSVTDVTQKVLPEKRREEKSNKQKSKPKKTFQKPQLEDIRFYAAELHLELDIEEFFDYYESKGWMVGKSPMKDWQATLRNWVRRSKHDQPKSRVFATEELIRNPNALAEYGYAAAVQEDEPF